MSASNSTLVGYLPAPEGYKVDFEHPHQTGHIQGYWTSGVGLTLATILLSIRIYTKVFISRNFGMDDDTWVIKASGVHGWEVPVDKFNTFSFVTACVSIIYVPCLGFAKISILYLYRRLSPIRWFKIAIYINMAIVTTYSVALMFAFIFPCRPVRKNWDPTITGGKCVDKPAIYLANAAINAITDIMILLLPIPLVVKLQMPTVQKFALLGVFAFGSATFVTSVVRLYYMVPMLSNVDQTYAISIPFVWVMVEANLIVICFCLPNLRTFLRRVAPKIIGEYSAHRGYGNISSAKKTKPSSKMGLTGPGSSIDRSNLTDRQYAMGKGGAGPDEIELSTTRIYAGRDGDESETGDRGRSADDEHDHDGSSDKAIWQTTTVTVSAI
ncbi:hypothetical protein A1O3_08160 [Capronia epimyces CBS 606.96]|uniref:Rhodopsin domain-containing protein n=1 Tax=Capronia epimyces CBS 606.96 TaxID=1182542 RepID=W9XRD1_9EURO|nr:uncharacterized protein A1O3_08160 [Capronia epimyces CBS 606.96]EXJ79875.1 hypothetical protein A1O3_08160 [Capronia epimyces CBS 606.96]